MLDLITSSDNAARTVVYLFSFLAIMLVALPLHEFAHAKAASLLGDDTPERFGRLTLNPFVHIDIMGVIALLLMGIGWAKPVPVNAGRCKKVKPKLAMLLISVAGPLANLFLAFVGMIVYRALLLGNYEILATGKDSFELYICCAASYFTSMNISLTVFNLLPIPPFDGSRIFLAFLPTRLYFKIMRYERVIFGVMFLLLIFGVFSVPLGFLSGCLSEALYCATDFVEYFFKGMIVNINAGA